MTQMTPIEKSAGFPQRADSGTVGSKSERSVKQTTRLYG
jgi:hypothetical protein